MTVHSFKEYLATARVHDNMQGDFVIDARQDDGLPDVTSWRELESYLFHNNACDGAMKGARLVWNNYRRQCRRRA